MKTDSTVVSLAVRYFPGKMPYPGLSGMEIVDFLKLGQRLKQPDGCWNKMYSSSSNLLVNSIQVVVSFLVIYPPL